MPELEVSPFNEACLHWLSLPVRLQRDRRGGAGHSSSTYRHLRPLSFTGLLFGSGLLEDLSSNLDEQLQPPLRFRAVGGVSGLGGWNSPWWRMPRG